MLPRDTSLLLNAFSAPRVNAYKRFFGNNLTNDEVFGVYLWNESISQSFFSVITLTEVILRNRFHSSLSNYYFRNNKEVVANYKQENWHYRNIQTIGNTTSCNWYNTSHFLRQGSLRNICKYTHHRRTGTPLYGTSEPSPDDVISKQSFGFWLSLVKHNPRGNWRSILADVFPKHRLSANNQWNSRVEIQRLQNRKDYLRDFRNRVAHHEPIWKFGRLYDEDPNNRTPLSGQARNVQDSIHRLNIMYEKYYEFLRWMSQEIYNDLMDSSLHKKIEWLLSMDGFTAHKNRNKYLPESMYLTKAKRELNSILKKQYSPSLYHKGKNKAVIYPIR